MRRYLVGGNWKCNGSLDFAAKFPKEVLANLTTQNVDVVVAPSTIHLLRVQEALAGKQGVHLSTQNTSLYGNGAYTGETSVEMLKDFGINWTILGHSERRHVFGESDEVVAQKVKRALDHDV